MTPKPLPEMPQSQPTPPMTYGAPPGPAFIHVPSKTRAELFRDALFWMLIAALALASLTLLLSLNSIISIWFREQWAPVARAVVSLVVILACGWGLMKLGRRAPAERRA